MIDGDKRSLRQLAAGPVLRPRPPADGVNPVQGNVVPAQLIGDDPSIKELRHLIDRVAASPARSIIIYGETGTGKGLVARMLHDRSPRAGFEFVDVNCAAIPHGLMESELFGHEKGAFTGAQSAKTGLIEVADRGTLFLDEIREMDPTLQAKLLNLLDHQRFRRVGAVRPIAVDVRFVTATNRILLTEVKAGRFREDLYYRLQLVAINIPPLRDRRDDIFVLTEHFLRSFGGRYGRRVDRLEPAVEDAFRRYSWPGNVRELENLLERVFILDDVDSVSMRHIPDRIVREIDGREPPHHAAPRPTDAPGPDGSAAPARGFHAATSAFQRRLILDALAASGGSLGRAARSLNLTRHALRHQMLKLEIEA
jgi:two-component system, NtrC family, response regulator AtoC